MEKIEIGEVWMHIKTEGKYKILNFGKLQVDNPELDMADCVVYEKIDEDNSANTRADHVDNKVWIRQADEFLKKFKKVE